MWNIVIIIIIVIVIVIIIVIIITITKLTFQLGYLAGAIAGEGEIEEDPNNDEEDVDKTNDISVIIKRIEALKFKELIDSTLKK